MSSDWLGRDPTDFCDRKHGFLYPKSSQNALGLGQDLRPPGYPGQTFDQSEVSPKSRMLLLQILRLLLQLCTFYLLLRFCDLSQNPKLRKGGSGAKRPPNFPNPKFRSLSYTKEWAHMAPPPEFLTVSPPHMEEENPNSQK